MSVSGQFQNFFNVEAWFHNHNSLQDIEMSNAILINSSQMMAFGKKWVGEFCKLCTGKPWILNLEVVTTMNVFLNLWIRHEWKSFMNIVRIFHFSPPTQSASVLWIEPCLLVSLSVSHHFISELVHYILSNILHEIRDS